MKIDEALVVCVMLKLCVTDLRCSLICISCKQPRLSILFLKVPESGNYTFYVACDDACELWLNTFENSNGDEETGKILLVGIQQGFRTAHNQWDL